MLKDNKAIAWLFWRELEERRKMQISGQQQLITGYSMQDEVLDYNI